MRRLLFFIFALTLPLAAQAQESEMEPIIQPASEVELDDFLWTNRLVVVFADTDADPRYQTQMARINDAIDDLKARDVIVLTDTDPKSPSAVRQTLRPRGFVLVVMGKDGKVAQRMPSPRSVREINASIDKMPLRQDELLEQRGIGSGG